MKQVTGCDRAGYTFARSAGARGDQKSFIADDRRFHDRLLRSTGEAAETLRSSDWTWSFISAISGLTAITMDLPLSRRESKAAGSRA